jgi:hypothetical protein
MNEKTMNQIAALISGTLSQEERDRLVISLAEDPEATQVLAALNLPEPAGASDVDLPFPVVTQFHAGICKGFFRIFGYEGFSLGGEMVRLSQLLNRVSSGTLPVCFHQELTLEFEIESLVGSLRIRSNESQAPATLEIHLKDPHRLTGYVEVWQNGALRQVFPASKSNPAPCVAISPGACLALRHSSSLTGIGLRLAPVEFTWKDWLSASLICGFSGHFSQAAAIMAEELAPRGGSLPFKARMAAFFDALRGLAKVEEFMLVPIPATRSGGKTRPWGNLAYRPAWEGIVASWPEVCQAGDPWQAPESGPAPIKDLSPEVKTLVSAVWSAVRGMDWEAPQAESIADPVLLSAWSALKGYHHLLAGEYETALASFRKAPILSGDPFSLEVGMTLASHLMVANDPSSSADKRNDSNQAVWKAILEPAMAACDQEEG